MDLSINMVDSIQLTRKCVHPSTGRLSVSDVAGGSALEERSIPGALPDPPSMAYQLDLHSQEKREEGTS